MSGISRLDSSQYSQANGEEANSGKYPVLLEKPPWTRLRLSRDRRSREGARPGSCYVLVYV
ncbi:hypothetical protein NQZ68_022550 [Dissostichus eleginoides]|nr:hypothetical protein NQZ68_022550 [Dissostichus eleginoides]